MDAAGLGHPGMARNAHEADQSTIVDVRGLRVGLLSYTYGLNSGPLPADRPWLVNTIEPRRILNDAKNARRAGAQFVVVLLHWGQEYRSTPTPFQREVAKRLLGAPEVDLILGHHVHVVQPIERVGSKWVAYGMGNSLSNQTPSLLCRRLPGRRAGQGDRQRACRPAARAGGALCADLGRAPELPDPTRAHRPGRPVAPCSHPPRSGSRPGPDDARRWPHSAAGAASLIVRSLPLVVGSAMQGCAGRG